MIACTSSRDRNPTRGRVQRFIGMARARWIMASASGSFRAANRKNERTDGRQPRVAAPNGVVPILFEVIKKREHQGGIQIGQHQPFGGFIPSIPSELEEQTGLPERWMFSLAASG